MQASNCHRCAARFETLFSQFLRRPHTKILDIAFMYCVSYESWLRCTITAREVRQFGIGERWRSLSGTCRAGEECDDQSEKNGRDESRNDPGRDVT